MPRLDLALLGPPRVTVDGVEVADFGYAKVLALLVYLGVEQGRAHSRDALAELLWPDQPASVGRASLRQALARLRQALGDRGAEPPLLLAARESVRLSPDAGLSSDVAAFARLLAAADAHAHREPAACPACLEAWARAVELYRGPLADGAAPRDAAGYDEWLTLRREWHGRRQLEALARLADAHEARGDAAAALAYARRALEIDPWREPAHRQVMRLLAASGERAAAAAQYERCRRTLAEELGVEPEEATTLLDRQIRAGGAGERGRQGAGEIGRGRERNESDPISAPPIAPAPLPAQPTSFVGREAELRELGQLLASPGCRTLTLLGPGGAGKTRLALRLAEEAAPHFADGVCWAPLAALRSADELAGALARALGCAADDTGDPAAILREALAPRRLLLVLDNFEHVVAGAGLVADLLAAAPGLRALVTSRERLQLRAEWVYDVAGLSYPRPGAPAGAAEGLDSVRLLLERARQARPGAALGPDELAAAARIALLVEGNPLALELAAAARRGRDLVAVAAAIEGDLDALSVSLRDVPERHRSVRAAVGYSWELLDGAERRALARLSVCRGGLTAEAAHTVAGAGEAALDTLADKSMLRRAGGRVELHELVRRFAAEQLAAAGEVRAAREAHLAWCLAFAERAEGQVGGAEQERWMALLEADHANLRAALAWAVGEGRAAEAQRICAALTRFWWMRGHVREAHSWLGRAVGLAGGDDAARARALHSLGAITSQLGDNSTARRLMEESLALERAVGRKAELVRVMNNLAYAYVNQGDYEPAEALIAEALEIDRALGDERGVAFDLGSLAQVAYFRADYARAAVLWAESLAGHRRAGDTHSVAVTLLNLGGARRLQGPTAEAQAALEEALELFRGLGSAYGISFSLLQLARAERAAGAADRARARLVECLPILASQGVTGELAGALALMARLRLEAGEDLRGARLWGAAMALLDERGASLQPPELLEFGLELAEARARAEPEAWAAGWAQGRGLTLEAAIAEALAGAGGGARPEG